MSGERVAGRRIQPVPLAHPGELPTKHGAPAGFDPIRFVGAKRASGVWQTIVSQMPPHQTYIEPFLGTGAIARVKKQAEVNFVNDLDGHAVMSFRQWVADHGAGRSYHFSVRNALELLAELSDDAQRGRLASSCLVYCDPPYLGTARADKGRTYYRHEMMSEEMHMRLLLCLVTLPLSVFVMVSGYRSDLYDRLLREWRRIDIPTSTRGGGLAVECVWMNFPEPLELHDYRWLGQGWRERQRINRKKARWKLRLERMPLLERRALLSAIDDTFRSGSNATTAPSSRQRGFGSIATAPSDPL